APLVLRCDATNAAGDSTATASLSITVVLPPAPPVILVPSAVNGNVTSGLTYSASVTVRAGMTYSWSAGSATITSAGGAAGVLSGGTSSITFVASSAGPLTIGCTETNAAGATSHQGKANPTAVAPPGTPHVTLEAPHRTAEGCLAVE